MRLNYILFVALALLVCACQSTPKDIAYFQDLEQYIKNNPHTQLNARPVIKYDDQLSIIVSAPVLDQELVAQFNLPTTSLLSAGSTTLSSTPNLQTYTVDSEGFINFPILGRISLAGKTKMEATQYLTTLISKYVTDPIVNLQFVSYQVTVLGEVNSPGPVSSGTGRLTILEALGAANDLTIFGNRKNVLIIRENNGIKEYGFVDLTKSAVFSSPYYYLQQNDVVVVESNDTRKKNSNFGSAENYQLSVYSMVLSTISIIATIIITVVNL
ncbi:MAG: polysaccharide biosynthesis/export family protein [Candidatus Symbiothrix sp.]|jgi:polysaccharide export outer membrane protein|nr:polysaccharide biosynthesis/export family protein [Candidatus Symbiothrix sp.]